jgi:hypothetical protein
MDSPIMQYANELRQLKDYLMHTHKRLKIPMIHVLSENERERICDMWRAAIVQKYDEKFSLLTKTSLHNRQDCYDALSELRHFQKQIVETLEN